MPFTIRRPVADGQVRLPILITVLVAGLVVLAGPLLSGAGQIPDNKPAHYPDWWFEREVVVPLEGVEVQPPQWSINYPEAKDHAAVNQGQLKWVAKQAYQHLRQHLPADLWTTQPAAQDLKTLIDGWENPGSSAKNYAAVNQGQLKHVAKYFYDLFALNAVAYHSDAIEGWSQGQAYPWTATHEDDANFAAASQGQLKNLFAFDLKDWVSPLEADGDADNDGLLDSFEKDIINASANDAIETLADVLPTSPGGGDSIHWDFDGDRVDNLTEQANGTDPTDYFNGEAPVITLVPGAQGQIGKRGEFLEVPYHLVLTRQDGTPLYGAPVRFTVIEGNAVLADANPDFSAPSTNATKYWDRQLIGPEASNEIAMYLYFPEDTQGNQQVRITVGTSEIVLEAYLSGLIADFYQGTHFGSDETGQADPIRISNVPVSFIENDLEQLPALVAAGFFPEGANERKFHRYSIRYRGEIQSDESGLHQFWIPADDGVRVWIDGKLVADDWWHQGAKSPAYGVFDFVAGENYSIVIELFDFFYECAFHLRWRKPSAGLSNQTTEAYVDVPSEALLMVDAPIPLQAPENLRPKAQTFDSVYFSWDAVPADKGEVKYRVYLDGVPVQTTELTAALVKPAGGTTSFTVEVEAVDHAGQASARTAFNWSGPGQALSYAPPFNAVTLRQDGEPVGVSTFGSTTSMTELDEFTTYNTTELVIASDAHGLYVPTESAPEPADPAEAPSDPVPDNHQDSFDMLGYTIDGNGSVTVLVELLSAFDTDADPVESYPVAGLVLRDGTGTASTSLTFIGLRPASMVSVLRFGGGIPYVEETRGSSNGEAVPPEAVTSYRGKAWIRLSRDYFPYKDGDSGLGYSFVKLEYSYDKETWHLYPAYQQHKTMLSRPGYLTLHNTPREMTIGPAVAGGADGALGVAKFSQMEFVGVYGNLDGDAMPDSFEQLIIDAKTGSEEDGILHVWQVEEDGDFDLDGIENYHEYLFGSDPTVYDEDADEDGIPDAFEIGELLNAEFPISLQFNVGGGNVDWDTWYLVGNRLFCYNVQKDVTVKQVMQNQQGDWVDVRLISNRLNKGRSEVVDNFPPDAPRTVYPNSERPGSLVVLQNDGSEGGGNQGPFASGTPGSTYRIWFNDLGYPFDANTPYRFRATYYVKYPARYSGTDPTLDDTDGDGISDGDEYLHPLDLDPLDPDSDNDGIYDGDDANPVNFDDIELVLVAGSPQSGATERVLATPLAVKAVHAVTGELLSDVRVRYTVETSQGGLIYPTAGGEPPVYSDFLNPEQELVVVTKTDEAGSGEAALYYVAGADPQVVTVTAQIDREATQGQPLPAAVSFDLNIGYSGEISASGLQFWLAADRGLRAADGEPPDNGDPIVIWTDQSGKLIQVTQTEEGQESSRPVYWANQIGGEPVVRFDGIDDVMNIPYGFRDFSQGASVFIVAKPAVGAGASRWLLDLGNGSDLDNLSVSTGAVAGGLNWQTQLGDGTGGERAAQTTTGFDAGNYQVLLLTDNGTSQSAIHLNGIETATATSSFNLDANTPRSVNRLGGRSDTQVDAVSVFEGDLAEVIVYNRTLSQLEVDRVYAYLSGKYGLLDANGNNLPDYWEAQRAGTFAVYPSQLSANLAQSESKDRPLILFNDTLGAIDYAIDVTGADASSFQSNDTATGSLVYTWEDIALPVNELAYVSNRNAGAEAVSLANFTFPYMGSDYSTLYVHADGYVTLAASDTGNQNASDADNHYLPNPSAPANLLAAFWDDLDPSVSGVIYAKEESDRVIVQYQAVAREFGPGTYTFQIVLYDDGTFEYRYQDIAGAADLCTVGYQNIDGTRGFQLTRNQPLVENGYAVNFGAENSFLQFSSVAGTVAAGSIKNITSTFQSGQLPLGTYIANVTVSETSPVGPDHQVQVNMDVTEGPFVMEVVSPQNGVEILESEQLTVRLARVGGTTAFYRVEYFLGDTELTEFTGVSSVGQTHVLPAGVFPAGVQHLRVVVSDASGNHVDVDSLRLQVLPDTDGDGFPDAWELQYGFDPNVADPADADTDGDGASRRQEYLAGSDPTEADTDGNGLNDGYEIALGLDPVVDVDIDGDGNTDSDGNGVPDEFEDFLGVDVNDNTDSDGDGIPDDYENKFGITDPNGDEDEDGLSNLLEYQLMLRPDYFDSDGDLLDDGYEYDYSAHVIPGPGWRLDPAKPNRHDEDVDLDETGAPAPDGLVTFEEFRNRTNPLLADTDADGVDDGVEVAAGSDPLDPNDKPFDPSDFKGRPVSEFDCGDIGDDIPSASYTSQTQTHRVEGSFGDESGSHSERWKLNIGNRSEINDTFGKADSFSRKLNGGRAWRLSLSHVGTDPAAKEENPNYLFPDYDYLLDITGHPGFILSDVTGLIQEEVVYYAQSREWENLEAYLIPIKSASFSKSYTGSDAVGPRYRKIALNGRPMADEQPEEESETDEYKEQTYIDAFDLSLRHDTSFIYIPIAGSELVLQANASVQETSWNQRGGLYPDEQFTLPLGVGWTSNLCSYIEMVESDGDGAADPISVTVVDEGGQPQRFGTRDGSTFFPWPSSRVDKKTFLNELTVQAIGGVDHLVLQKKYGNKLTYEPIDLWFGYISDRLHGSDVVVKHNYWRLVEVEDRYGNKLQYTYGDENTSGDPLYFLIPLQIKSERNPDQAISIVRSTDCRRVESITDAKGKIYDFVYSQNSAVGAVGSHTYTHTYYALDRIKYPDGTERSYTYEIASEPEVIPGANNDVLHFHANLKTITDKRGQTHTLTYEFNQSRQYYASSAGATVFAIDIGGLPQPVQDDAGAQLQEMNGGASSEAGYKQMFGLPRRVVEVDLPGITESAVFSKGNSRMRFGKRFSANSTTEVTDTLGNKTYYDFGGVHGEIADRDSTTKNGGGSTSKSVSVEWMIYYTEMQVHHGAREGEGGYLGTEVFNYDLASGLSLSRMVDLSGNETRWEFGDPLPSGLEFDIPGEPSFMTTWADPTRKIDALGREETYQYGARRIMSEMVDVHGTTTSYNVDSLGRRTGMTVTDKDGTKLSEETYSYDTAFPGFMTEKRVKAFSSISGEAWEQDLVTQHVPDSYGRVQDTIVAPGSLDLTTSYTYDVHNNRETVTDPRGNVTSYAYDSLNRLVEVTHPAAGRRDGSVATSTTRYVYDERGNRVVEKDEEDQYTLHFYDALSRKTQTVRDMDGFGLPTLPDLSTPSAPQYLSDGNQGSVTSGDIATAYSYNQVNSIRTVTDPRGIVTTNEYDALQRLTQVFVNASSSGEAGASSGKTETEYRYELAKNPGASGFSSSGFKPTSVIRHQAVETGSGVATLTSHFTYDPVYREIKKEVEYEPGEFAVTTTAYPNVSDGVEKLEQTVTGPRRPVGKVTETIRDGLQRVTRVIDGKGTPEEAVNETVYSSTGLAFRSIDAVGRRTETEFDAAGRSTVTWAPDPQTGQINREAADDAFGDTGSPKTETLYDDNGNVEATLNPRGYRWDYAYDARNRRVTETAPLVEDASVPGNPQVRPVTETHYDGVGNIVKIIGPRGGETTTEYDRANRPVKTWTPLVPVFGAGQQRLLTTTGYDKNSNILLVTDPQGNKTVNFYDALNRLTATATNPQTGDPSLTQGTPAAGDILVSYEYDDAGNRTRVVDGEGAPTAFRYDGLGRNTQTIWDAGRDLERRKTMAYDGAVLTQRTDELGQVTTYTYDGQNRLQALYYIGREVDNRLYAYDLVGNLLGLTYPEDAGQGALRACQQSYDALNRVVSETSAGVTHTHLYDKAGNRRQTDYGVTNRRLASSYDALNRLGICTETVGGSGTSRVSGYGYDLSGNIVRKAQANGVEVAKSYDLLNRVGASSSTQSGQTLALLAGTYAYDRASNLREVAETYPHASASLNDRTVTNTYDRVYRLATEAVTGGSGAVTTTYAYDDANNRVSKMVTGGGTPGTTTYVYGDGTSGSGGNANQLLALTPPSGPAVTYGYDANGNRTARSIGGTVDAYAYDVENRLVTLTQANTDAGQTPGTYAYTYDHRTRRVGRDESAAAGTADTVVFAGGTSAQEYVNGAGTPAVEYIRGSDYGGGVGGVLYTLRSGTARFNAYNSRGDVVAQTDATGTLSYESQYEAHGTRTAETGSTPDRQKANTKDEDPTGLLNEGFRYRDLQTGSFLTRDPLGFVDGPNVYTYVAQNPWSSFDPHGLALVMPPPTPVPTVVTPHPAWVPIIGFAVGYEIGNIPAIRDNLANAIHNATHSDTQVDSNGNIVYTGDDKPTLQPKPKKLGEQDKNPPVKEVKESPNPDQAPVASGSEETKPTSSAKEDADKKKSNTKKKKTDRAARREAMREQGIPTSQQPDSQTQNESGREYTYTVPKDGGGTEQKSVQQQTRDNTGNESHDQPHWESGSIKTDKRGNPRMNRHGRPQLRNQKSKVHVENE